MKHPFLILTVLIAFAYHTTLMAAEAEKPLQVFIFAGQSNMVGQEPLWTLPRDLWGEQKKAWFFEDTEWRPLSPGLIQRKTFGPEISFAQKLSTDLDENIGIIKHALNGTNLDQQWSPTDPHSLYAQLLAKVKAAQKTKNIRIVGMLWMQGETDAGDHDMAARYSKNLSNFIRAARSDFQNPEMIFIAGRINPDKTRFPFVDVVREAQMTCNEPHYAFVDCDHLPKGGDNLHYNANGLVELGNTFADRMRTLMKKEPKPISTNP